MIRLAADLGRIAVAKRLRRAALQRLRERKLRRIVHHAAVTVPFYRDRFRRHGIDPREIEKPADLRWLPILTRAEVQEAGRALLPDGVHPDDCISARTSGSTGKPLEVFLSRRDLAIRQAVELRTLLAVGLRPWDRLVTLGRQRPLERQVLHRLGLYRSWAIPIGLPLDRQIQLLRRTRPTILWAYPTALRVLMDHLHDDLGDLVRPRLAITAAERLDGRLRERFLAACPVEVFDFYGAVEVGRIAAECPAHTGLHLTADFMVAEAVPDPSLPADLAQVIVTTLEAFTTPLIRYRIGDLCSPHRDGCRCGSAFPLIDRVAGRETDIIRLPGGRLLPCHRIDGILRDLDGLQQYRVVQEAEDHLVVLLEPGPRLDPDAPSAVRRRVLDLVGEGVRVEVEKRGSLATDEVKARAFVSKLAG